MKSNAMLGSIADIFANSSVKALQQQFDIASKVVKPFKYDELEFVTSKITMDTQRLNGFLVLHLEKSCLLKMYNHIFEDNIEELDGEIKDFNSECLNILYCLAKNDVYEQKNIDLGPAIPVLELSLIHI